MSATAHSLSGSDGNEVAQTDDFVHVMEVDETAAPSLVLKVSPRHDSVGVQAPNHTTQICATVEAADLPEEDESARAPVDIIVALDKSGSMMGNKISQCIKTLQLILRDLRPKDRFGLVTFSDQATIEIPARKMTEHNKAVAARIVDVISVGGLTNLSGGIGKAAQEIHAIEEPNEVRTVLLLTDGHANRGIQSADGIVELVKGCLLGSDFKSSSPVTMHTFGYGSDHDQQLLQSISGATSGGTYYFVDTDSNVTSAFGDVMGGILSVVAQNVTLNISVPKEAQDLGAKIVKVHHESCVRQENGSFSVDLGDFYAAESRDVLFEVALAADEGLMAYENGPVPHATVMMSYTDTLQKKLVSGLKASGRIARPPGSEVSPADKHVSVQWLRICATQALADAKEISRLGNLTVAKANISSALSALKRDAAEMGAVSDPLVIQLIADLNEVLAGLETRETYESYGRHGFETRHQTHRQQRCSEATASKGSCYRTSRKAAFARKYATGSG